MTTDDPQALEQPSHATIRYTRVHDVDRLILGVIDCEHDRNTVGDHHGIAPPP